MHPQVKQARKAVYKGWWPLLDKYIPMMLELDPDCEIMCKEKFGLLRLRPYNIRNGRSWMDFNNIQEEAEKESATICEVCGAPGRLRMDGCWRSTLCDHCAVMDRTERIRMADSDSVQELETLVSDILCLRKGYPMKKQEFNSRIQPLCRKHKEMFGYIPDIHNYVCTPEEFVVALARSVIEQREIGVFLKEGSK
ncbi:MAG: hypothetical protein IJC17_04755 [Clostridia bacterium]|nr:hypothetical protein [Clostridia bacterium]